MHPFIQTLERRVLLSATADTLRADQSTIDADAAALKADLQTTSKALASDLKTVTADVKGSTDKTQTAAQLKTLKADEKTLLVKLKKDETALLKAGFGPSHKAAAHGVGVINSPSNSKLSAKLAADIATLSTALAAPLATFVGDAAAGGIPADLDALVASNPTNTDLATHAATAKTNTNTQLTTLVNAATKFSTDVGTLKADLQTLVL